ncbi:unnamed protein product [Symbiodinium sp. CCMP2592]|nr:unnamed protein product [Symbiodinium sp. CCMP2592]
MLRSFLGGCRPSFIPLIGPAAFESRAQNSVEKSSAFCSLHILSLRLYSAALLPVAEAQLAARPTGLGRASPLDGWKSSPGWVRTRFNDLTHPVVLVLGAMLAPPCTSFSVARDRIKVIRDPHPPWGCFRIELQKNVIAAGK